MAVAALAGGALPRSPIFDDYRIDQVEFWAMAEAEFPLWKPMSFTSISSNVGHKKLDIIDR